MPVADQTRAQGGVEANRGVTYVLAQTWKGVWDVVTDHPCYALGYWEAARFEPFDPYFHLKYRGTAGLTGEALEHAQHRYEQGRLLVVRLRAHFGSVPEWRVGARTPPFALVRAICEARGIPCDPGNEAVCRGRAR